MIQQGGECQFPQRNGRSYHPYHLYHFDRQFQPINGSITICPLIREHPATNTRTPNECVCVCVCCVCDGLLRARTLLQPIRSPVNRHWQLKGY